MQFFSLADHQVFNACFQCHEPGTDVKTIQIKWHADLDYHTKVSRVVFGLAAQTPGTSRIVSEIYEAIADEPLITYFG
jgi:mannitol/fructose-specific phosphotransferase system IIA component